MNVIAAVAFFHIKLLFLGNVPGIANKIQVYIFI